MQVRILFAGLIAFALAAPLPAADSEVAQLKAQLQQLQTSFEQTRREQERQIDDLTRKIEALSSTASATQSASTPPAKTEEQKKLEEQLAAELTPPSNAAPVTPRSSADHANAATE